MTYYIPHRRKWDRYYKTHNSTKARSDRESKEFMKGWRSGKADRARDLDRLNEILKKHQPSWWD